MPSAGAEMAHVCVVPSVEVVAEAMLPYATPGVVEYLHVACSSVATIIATLPDGTLLPMGAITVMTGGVVWVIVRLR